MTKKVLVGKIIHFYPKISVAVVELEDVLRVGDKISVERESGAFEQIVDSIQIEHENVKEAKKGDAIGLRVADRTREGAKVYKVVE